jgi:hypothetical protein
MDMQHVAAGEASDDDRTWVHADHVVPELGGENRNIASLGSRRRRCGAARLAGTDDHEIGVVA